MVKTARAASSLGALRALNQPQPVRTETDDRGMPFAVHIGRDRLAVASVEDAWRIEDEWWREQPVERTYFACVVDGGIKVTVFQDIASKEWYVQRV